MFSYKETLNEVMQRKMSRSEFLRYLLMVVVSVIGITRLIESLHGGSNATTSDSYGSGPYGGSKRN